METAGKLVEDDELREAMKDSGIGTPATRAAIIERLVDVGYIEREGRALHATEKGVQVIRLLDSHPLTSPALTGDWENRLTKIESGGDSRPAFMKDIAQFTRDMVEQLDKLKDVKIERQNLGPCPVCGRDVMENRKGYSCWSREDPGCGFVIWKKKAGKNLPASVVKELMDSLRASRAAGEDPGVGRTAKPVTGFRGRSGRTFRAKLRLEQSEEGKWRVEFDEDWAKEPPKGEADDEGGTPAAAAGAEAEGAANGAAADAAPAAQSS
jgi:DNA topoisomerase-3